MRKRIRFRQLRVGMFVEELEDNGGYDGYFPHHTLIAGIHDLQRLGRSKAMSVVINVAKGLDVDKEEVEISPHVDSAEHERHVIQKYSTAEVARAKLTIGFTLPKIRQILQSVQAARLFDMGAAGGIATAIIRSSAENPGALIELAKLKKADEGTFLHCLSVSALMVAFGRKIGFDQESLRQLGIGGLLHDLGKMGIPPAILNKTGALTKEEFAVVRRHPEIGSAILKSVSNVPAGIQDICLYHHEKFDGSGYPHHLKETKIPVWARIASVCDVYDALTTIRPYKRAYSHDEAIEIMTNSPGHFDPDLLRAFITNMRGAIS